MGTSPPTSPSFSTDLISVRDGLREARQASVKRLSVDRLRLVPLLTYLTPGVRGEVERWGRVSEEGGWGVGGTVVLV